MNRKIIGIFVVMLLMSTTLPKVESIKESKKISTLQSDGFIFGEITNLRSYSDSITFNAVNIIGIDFSPFSFHTCSSGEYFEISKEYTGFISVHFIIALVNTYINNSPVIDCIADSSANKLVITMVSNNLSWKDIEITTNNTNVAWRVFDGTTPVDGWNSTTFATTDVYAGEFVFFEFNTTTLPSDVRVFFKYIPTSTLLGNWLINV